MNINNHEYPLRPVIGVGGIVIENGLVLLIRRGTPPMCGEWSIPGGKLEAGETLVEGVQRELLEETHLQVRVLDFIEVFERIFTDSYGGVEYHFVVLDYFCERAAGDIRAGGDVLDVRWVTEEGLAELSLTAAATRVLRKAFQMWRERTAIPS